MKALIGASAIVVVLGVSAYAQDSTVNTKTTVKADDAQTVVMRGCLSQLPGSGTFALTGAVASAGDELKSKTRVETDVDKNSTTVKGKTTTKVDDDHAISTSGTLTTYEITPRAGVNLAPEVGHQVEITALMLEPAKGDKDANVKIKEETKATVEHAPDTKTKSTTKAELPRGANASLTAMSVKQISPTCAH